MFLGDTHGKVDRIHAPIRMAKRREVDAIVQVGDFGFLWPGDNRLPKLVNVLKQFGSIPLYFLDGNHEGHDQLAEMGATPDAGRMVEIAEGIFYLPRGFAWEWDGVRFMSVGGAVSIDVEPDPNWHPPWPGRTQGINWFPQEKISYPDVERAIAQGPVDVLLCHDVPEIPPYLGETLRRFNNLKLDNASRSNRMALAAIAEEVKPKLIVHGHYHVRYNDLWQDSVVCGLSRDNDGQSQYVIIETENLDRIVDEAREQIENRRLT